MYIYFIVVVGIVVSIFIVGKSRIKKKRLRKKQILASRLPSVLKANKNSPSK